MRIDPLRSRIRQNQQELELLASDAVDGVVLGVLGVPRLLLRVAQESVING